MANILAVDDEEDVRALLQAALARRRTHGENAGQRGFGDAGKHAAGQDCHFAGSMMMPGEDGFATCARIRTLAACPILFLTAKTQEADVLTGLGQGGDDYLAKPFRIAELRARVAAHLRRERRAPCAYLRRGGVSFDMPGKAAFCNDVPIRLTKGEYAICEFLALHAGQTFSKEQIYEAVFGFEGTADDSAVAEHVKNIRAKLKAFGLSPIETVWGVGYKWKSE